MAAERAKMVTIEKMMVQIFDHKSRILDQVKQQTRFFDHHLASKLLLDGIAPPPWLLTPDLPSWTSDPKELNAEDLISEILLSRPRPTIPFSSSHRSVFEKPVVEVSTGQLSNGLCREVCAENKGFDEGDDSSVFPWNRCGEDGYASVGVSTLDHRTTGPHDQRDEDPSITSPQDQRDTRMSDVNHDLALSLARLHRSRSRQRALELRNSAKVDKCQSEDDNNLSGCSRGTNRSAVPFLQVDQLEEMDPVKPVDTGNDICAEADIKLGDTWNKEKGGRIDCIKYTRSRRPGLQHSPLNVGSSSNAVREDGAILTDSVGPSVQQSNHGNRQLELVSNSLIGDQNCGETESKVGDKRGKEKGSSTDFKRITRSKISTQQKNHVTESFVLGGSCNNHKESVTSCPTRKAQLFNHGEVDECAEEHSGRITRSQTSRPPCNTIYDLSKPVSLSAGQGNLGYCVVNRTEHSTKSNSAMGYITRSKGSHASRNIDRVREDSHSNISGHISAEKSLLIQEDEEPFASNSTDASDEENNVDECAGGNTRMKPTFSAEVTVEWQSNHGKQPLEPVSNSLIGYQTCEETESKAGEKRSKEKGSTTGFRKIKRSSGFTQQNNSVTELYKLDGCEKMKIPVNSQDLGHIVTRSRPDALQKALETKSLKSSGRTSVKVSGQDIPRTSPSQPANLEGCAATVKETEILLVGPVEDHPVCLGSNLTGACVVGPEVLVPCPADTSMPVEPKQLNFNYVEVSSSNGMSAVAIETENMGRLLEKSPAALSESVDTLDKSMAQNYNEDDSISLEERVDFSKDEEPQRESSEAQADDTSTAIVALDEHAVSPVKETSHLENVVTDYLQQTDKNSKERSTLTGMDVSLEIDARTLMEAKPADLLLKDSGLETFSINQELSKDADFPQATKPDPCASQEAYTDHEVELPCAVSEDESMGNIAHSTVNAEMLHCHAADLLRISSHENTNVDLSESTQNQIIVKSAAQISSIESSGTLKKRKRIDPLNTLSNPPVTNENAVLPFDRDGESKDLLSEEHSPNDILESHDLQVSHEEAAQSVIGTSQVEEMYQVEERNTPEDSKSSPKLQVDTADFSLADMDINTNTSFTFANEKPEADLVPSEVEHAAGDCEGYLMEETRDVDTASIVYDGESQFSLEENDNSYHLEEKFETVGTECMTNGEALMQEEKSDLLGASKFPYCSVGSPHSPSLHLTGVDETMPLLEKFIMQSDDEQPCNAHERINFDKLNLPNNALDGVSILERLCKSACMQTPISCSSAPYNLQKFSNLYQSVPTGLLEGMDMKEKLPICDEVGCPSYSRSQSDGLPSTTGCWDWDIKKPCVSPVWKAWDRIIKSGSSGKRRSLIPELPCINEENENIEEVADTYQEGMVSEMLTDSVKREPLAEINENRPASDAELYAERFSLESVNTEFGFNGTHSKAKKNPGNGRSIQRRFNNKENETLGATSLRGKPGPLQNRFSKPPLSAKTSSRKGGLSITETETKRSNIVSNISSFIPLVQQKQAPAVVTGKRDVKVKALGAAEAAKRAAEKKENERKLKKEAMKVERARLEQENLRQLELQKKRKEEERKKKEAEMAAKKRQREEEEKKERERKRLRLEETRKQHKEHEQKLQAAKEEKNVRTMDEKGHEIRESKDGKRNCMMEKGKRDDNCPTLSEAEPTTTRASTSDGRRAGIVHKDFEASSDVGNSLKVNNIDKPTTMTRTENLVATTSQEQSYDISPYKCSDDEDEEDDDIPNKKFVPSWASKNHIALAVCSQDRVDPERIFPTESFCSIAEVLLPRRYWMK